MSLAERAQFAIARGMARLPDRMKIALAGGRPVVVDGQQLDPQLQLFACAAQAAAAGSDGADDAEGRRRYRHVTQAFRGTTTPVASVRDVEVSGAAGMLQARHYAPAPSQDTGPRPLTVYFHGGGFVIGDLDTHDEPCRILCREAGVHVLSIAYRLAPEHPFPAAIDDAAAALRWARAHAEPLGADPARVAVGGDSAGGNLAAVVAADEAAQPFARLLIYPATDPVTPRPSQRLFAEGFALTLRDRDEFFRQYTSGFAARLDDPRLSAFCATSLARTMPSLIVLAGFDVLRDEGEAYGEALQRAGAPVEVRRFPSLEHGFIHLIGVCPAARRAMSEIAAAWRTVVKTT